MAKRGSSSGADGARVRMAGLRLLATLILLFSTGSTVAQDPSIDPAGPEGQSKTSEQSLAAETGVMATTDGDEMPESLRSPVIDFLASGPTIQAHKLRGLKAEVAGLILGSPTGGDIAFEALAMPLRGIGGKANVPIFVEIDGPTLLEANSHNMARFELYAYALGDEREIASFLAEVFVVDIQELGEALWQNGLKYYGHLELPPGEYQLRILVRNYHSGASTLREIKLTVPAFDQLDQPFVFPVFQPPSARGAWLPVHEWESLPEYPLWIGEQAVSPAVRPVLIAGRQSEAHVMAYRLPSGVTKGRIELLQEGVAVTSANLGVASISVPTELEGLQSVAVTFDTPQVTPGVYSLRVDLNGAMSPPVPVVIVQQGTLDRALLWTDLRGQLGAGTAIAHKEQAASPPSPGETGSRGKREERQIRKLATSYREVLVMLSQNSSAARSALLDLETSVLTEGTVETLKSAQLSVAEQLSDADIESLIPVLALHDDLYSIYRQRSLFSLGFHAREIIELLAELYAERGGSKGSHIVAARVLASLGGHLQAANLPSSSRRLYRRALAHDAHSMAALIGLATSYERYGDYPRTVAVLEDLVSAHPKSGEGLLRLSINLDRLGARARARQLVERAVELEAPNWVRSLASQQLARILVEIGTLDRAAELLEASLEENPVQHGSMYLLAHIYDRQRQPYKSLELLDSVVASRDPSPRKTYDSWPETSLEAIRRELSEAAAVRVALVSKILNGAQQ